MADKQRKVNLWAKGTSFSMPAAFLVLFVVALNASLDVSHLRVVSEMRLEKPDVTAGI